MASWNQFNHGICRKHVQIWGKYNKYCKKTQEYHHNKCSIYNGIDFIFNTHVPLYYVLGSFVFIPLLLYFLFAISVFFEVILKTKTIYSLLTFILLPVQHISYGLGVLWNLILPVKKLILSIYSSYEIF